MRYLFSCFLGLLPLLWVGCGSDSATQPETPATSSSSSLLELSSSSSSLAVPHHLGIDPCQFSFGAGWFDKATGADFQGLDHITVWIGDNDFFNNGWEGAVMVAAHEVNATPVFYSYVIAEYGKDQGLVDCDTRKTPNHCTDGAQIIRDEWESILDRYATYASGMRDFAEMWNITTDPNTYSPIWLIEPDFYQYSESSSEQDLYYKQMGGGIPDSVLAQKFSEIVDTIKMYLPAAQIAIDISPWIKDQKAWYAHFNLDRVDYAFTSGGRTLAASEHIRGTQAKWADIYQLVGKPILADAGYGAAGSSTGHDDKWDIEENLVARIADGVIGISQQNAGEDYATVAQTLRQSLPSLLTCPTP